jgi:uncharacterized protein
MTGTGDPGGGTKVIEQYFDIMNRLDIGALGDLLTEDVVVRLPFAPAPVPQRTEGRDAVLALYGGFPSLVSPLGFHDRTVLPVGQPLATPGEYVAEYRSDCTMLSTGQPYRNSYISLFTVRDGQLAAIAEFFDPLVFLTAQAFTITPPPAVS